MNTLTAIIIAILGSFLGAIGAFLIKKNNFKLNMNIIKNYQLITGIILYGLGPIVSIITFKGQNLTIIYPFFMFSYVWSSLLARKYLNENMNLYKWAGISLIIFGTTLTII